MTVNEVYVKTLNKVNKNLNSNNVTLDRQRFVMMYNEEQIRRILHVLTVGGDDLDLREIQFLLKPQVEITDKTDLPDRVNFKLPSDYLDISSAYCNAVKGDCKDKVFLWEIKDKNYTEKLSDEYNKPSFEYREAPYIIADNQINIFVDSFEINATHLSYYRYPKSIDIEGYINLQNATSINIDPEGDQRFIDRITSMVAESYARNYEYTQKFQLEKDRILNNN